MTSIAIVGIAHLFPGSHDLEGFWQNLQQQRDSRTHVNPARQCADPADFSGSKGDNDKHYSHRGGYIEQFDFDATGYQVSAEQLSQLDCHQHWILQVCKQALLDAGVTLTDEVLKQTGLVLGALSFPTQGSNQVYLPLYHRSVEAGLQQVLGKDFKLEAFDQDYHTTDHVNDQQADAKQGLIAGYTAGLVANALGLGRGHYALDAACASSLYSVKLACDALIAGRSDVMLASAVSGSDPFFINMGFSIFQAYPANGISAPFDQQSQGLFAGEGAGVLVLKRLDDALRDQDKIYATIEGVGLSNDGRGQFVLSPNSKGQVLAYQRAYLQAKLKPSDVDYIECHATGTPLGDKVELNSMSQFFGDGKQVPLIGSVKGNIGHLLTAAGMPSIVKTILSMQHNQIPASIGINAPISSGNLAWGEQQLVRNEQPWPANNSSAPKRAGVSAFGFGGCNAHLVLQQPPATDVKSIAANKRESSTTAMAITGVACHVGRAENIVDFAQIMSEQQDVFVPLPPLRWKGMEQQLVAEPEAMRGGFIEQFELDFMQFKVPPNNDDSLIPQQLLLMKVTDQALQDGKVKVGDNVAVLVAMSAEPETHQFRGRVNLQTQLPASLKQAGITLTTAEQAKLQAIAMDSVLGAAKLNQYTSFIGNIMASRIASLWDFNGPAFTISSEENSVYNCLQIAHDMLVQGEVEAVVVAAVDLAASAENFMLRQQLSADFYGHVSDGAGAIVLRLASDEVNSQPYYGQITDLNFSTHSQLHELNKQSNDADIRLVDITGSDSQQGQQELQQRCQQRHPNATVQTSSEQTGHLYAASGLFSLLSVLVKLNPALPSPAPQGQLAAAYMQCIDGSLSQVTLQSAVNAKMSKAFMVPTPEKVGLVKAVVLGGPSISNTIIEQGTALSVNLNTAAQPTTLAQHEQASQVAQTRQQGLNDFARLVRQTPLPKRTETYQAKTYQPKAGEIWNYDDLVEYSEGSIAKVFGPEYAIIDSYPRRVRLPTTDYLLVSRVTKLNAKVNEYKPCTMTTEYDIPLDAPYLVDGQIPWAVAVESGQCDLMLISYLGIDFENKGERVYRLLDCTLTFLADLPKGGETLRYDISINHFARNGDTLLFFFSYECFVGDTMVLKMDGGCAGFFTDQELADGKGVIKTQDELKALAQVEKQHFTPLLAHQQTAFNTEAIRHLIQGDVAACFGAEYATDKNSSLCFSSEKFLMIEQVSNIDIHGGPWGLGSLQGEKCLDPQHWYFPCHFKDDQVMAGSLMAEGCGQLLQFYMMYLGLHTLVEQGRFQPMANEPQKVRCRGQVLPQHGTLVYRMQVTEIGLHPMPYAKADIDIVLNGKVVVDFKNLGVMIKGVAKAGLKLPNTRLPCTSAPLMAQVPDLSAEKIKGVVPLKHVPAPVVAGENRTPDTLPFTPYHLFEFATGDICQCFGEDYRIYDGLIPPRTPCGDLQLTTRVIDVQGKRGDLKHPASCIAEYDVPADAWYFQGNSHHNYMPYSILMEISLQPNGFISGYMGTTLGFPGTELFFRNLDGQGELLREVDLRGKTIVNESTLKSTVIAGTNIIQSFDFVLSTDGAPFYQGSAVFGYFKAEALTHQLGLDNGKVRQAWYLEQDAATVGSNQMPERIDLTNQQNPLFAVDPKRPHYRLAGGRLNFVDTVYLLPNSGTHQLGYCYAERTIDPSDWFFQFHFHQDPVMPGSLGVEAIIEVMQVFALKQDLGGELISPRFMPLLSNVKWKYRGQINPLNTLMNINVQITQVIREPNKVTLIANADLSKDGLRIYEVTDIALCIKETEQDTANAAANAEVKG
ncbi:3-hydroxyacyl-[acyl-carrier-protein] dehydratase FabA [Motilimonas cestriensis]|uniref:3-hydroxyacyl-[acyl-carrier-protein] dehydratase FabA n=1 Tax=Motilimonas cestriensis TaxID=2742685 RepID=A0ABS8WFS9_9GAMM|nr:beta-ketoacyl synthase N-terminal-like domain-containing protein [Motilimonas cestriensis]MCE2597158.1 3-hydroxyacyl-[acyl-carrier-protein] dehydratase FabA [Motilimonas cestriensis]